jgi:hypothetical protein
MQVPMNPGVLMASRKRPTDPVGSGFTPGLASATSTEQLSVWLGGGGVVCGAQATFVSVGPAVGATVVVVVGATVVVVVGATVVVVVGATVVVVVGATVVVVVEGPTLTVSMDQWEDGKNESVPRRQRSWTLCPTAAGGRLTMVVT